MSIKSELEKLKEPDIWSFMLFVLFKVKDLPEYAGISELAYVLDKKNLLKLCEYFGGCTITIPRIDELEGLIYGLLLYQYVDIERMDFDEALKAVHNSNIADKDIKHNYLKIKEVLKDYEFQQRSRA